MTYEIMARGSPWVTPSLLCKKCPDPYQDQQLHSEQCSGELIQNDKVTVNEKLTYSVPNNTN